MPDRVEASSDLLLLERTARHIIGARCGAIKVHFSTALLIELGEIRYRTVRSRRGETSHAYGRWAIHTNGTRFELRHDGQALADDRNDLDNRIAHNRWLLGETLISLELRADFGALFRFSGDYELEILPGQEDAEYPEIPYWTIEFQEDEENEYVLEAGYGQTWSFLPSTERRF